MIRRRSLLLAGVALPAAARRANSQCVTDTPSVDACLGGVRITAAPPSLDLSFMNPGTLPSGVTLTRTSIGTYVDATGTVQTAAANAARWDYDPVTHVLRGLLIEEQRANILLNSATLGTQSVTVSASAYTLSFYGTGTVTLSGTSTAGPLTGTGAFPTRVSLTFTPTAGTLTLTVTGTVQNAQLEVGAYATSYIPTTVAAVTRTADICTTPTSAWFNAAASSLATDYMVLQNPNPSAALNRDVCCLSNVSTSQRLILRGQNAAASTALFGTSISGVTTFSTSLGSITANAVTKIAASWDGSTGTGSLNGGAPAAYSVGVPSGITTLTMGNDYSSAGLYVNGYIRRVRYWPQALTAAQLQAATT